MSWLGKAAVLWVFDEAPDVPSCLVSTLLAYARYADENGQGAHPSAATVAMHTRKTERNAKKDIAALRELGLLRPGDQRIVAHIRADKRPFVYDLAMPRGVVCDTPQSPNGVSHTTARGVAQGQHGVSHTTPKEFLKNSGRSARANGAAAPPRSQPQPAARVPPIPATSISPVNLAALLAATKDNLERIQKENRRR